jgi:prepilin-type processing-associated H-X9-DG protein
MEEDGDRVALAPFGWKDLKDPKFPRLTKLSEFTDGTSNTMLMSEVIFPNADEDFDIRGDMMNDGDPCTMYMTINKPNASESDVSPFVPPVGPSPAPYDPADPPYTNVGSAFSHKAARSQHSGGVSVAFADGSVRMVQDSIEIAVWQAMGSLNGEEILSE